MLKDHYRTLGITPQSPAEEIRRCYRQLAKRYHPDRHQGDKTVHAHFREIQEAYETLTDPARKEVWLQQRWLQSSQGKLKPEETIRTAPDILKRLLVIERGFAAEDPWRTNATTRLRRIEEILCQDHIEILADDPVLLDTAAETLLRCGRHLDPTGLDILSDILERILPAGHPANASLQDMRTEKYRDAQWSRWKMLILLTATLLCCWLMSRMA